MQKKAAVKKKVVKHDAKNLELVKRQQKEKQTGNDKQAHNSKRSLEKDFTSAIQTTNEKTVSAILQQQRGYELKRKLGRGAFGIVYEAVKENRYFACKVIDTKHHKKNRFRDIKSEIYVLNKLNHQNLIKLFEHFMIDETMYIVLELATGGTISDYVRRKGPLHEGEAKRLYRQIVSAVYHMHTQGISHRDLKMGNILLTEKGECKVTDFGLSRLSYTKRKGIIYCKKYSGTEPYMAPEILCLKYKSKAEADLWYYDPLIADIWALGIILYAMLNKSYPFNPEDKEIMLGNQLNKKWKYVRNIGKKLSEEVKDLIRHSLDPEIISRITFHCINTHPWLNTDVGESPRV